MSGLAKSTVLLTFGLLGLGSVSQGDTFLEKCFPHTDFSKAKIECTLSQSSGDLKFTLVRGVALNVTGISKFGETDKNFKITRLTHMEPRLTEAGPIEESLRFLGTTVFGSYTATVSFACDQTVFALVGYDKTSSTNSLPNDHAAPCQVEILK